MAFFCVAAFDAALPPAFILAEALQDPLGCEAFASEWLVLPSSFSHTLLDVPILTALRVLCLLLIFWASTGGGSRPVVLAVAYPAFRISTLFYTCYIACKLGELDFAALPSPELGYFLCVFSLFACWITSILPYIQASEEPMSYGSTPLLTECAICLSSLAPGDESARLCNRPEHSFHERCLQPWARSHRSCPICRGQPQGRFL
eukprot:TRINITY_DN76883_c0_g1_i1.p1 TRINITY_DN76883_c0_g1~~TRINITY_DN76883_c0_g1_i1.p1  ORF type:complete len:216 (+),score=19.02 TRINITY_DN76883_c0_g1_i1:37-648(+)